MIDEIGLAILQSRLDLITEEMGIVLGKTAQSPIFAESHDYSCFVAGSDGTVVSFADGIPMHTGSGGYAVRRCVEYWSGKIEPGDIFILNDPYFSHGNHLPDWTMIAPVHSDGEDLLGFACSRAHQIDIGGGYMGSYNSNAREIFEEGIRLPPMRLYQRGERRQDVWDLLMLNTRLPETVAGDVSAMLGSCRIGSRRVRELAQTMGIPAYRDGCAEILNYGERVMRHFIAALPDGIYKAQEVMNNNVVETVDVTIRVTVEVEGSNIVVDFTGSDPRVPGFKNSPLVNTYAATYLGLRSVIAPGAPLNEGAYRMIKVIAPEGSILNPGPPAAHVLCTTHPAHEIVHVIWRALADAIPGKVSAGWGRQAFPLSSGVDDHGQRYAMYHWGGMGGAGATGDRDGMDQVGMLISMGNLKVPSLELYEQLYPVTFLAHELRCDGGGAGELRGGTGAHYSVLVEREATWSFRCEGLYTPSGFGIEGGTDGAAGILDMVGRDDGKDIPTPQYGLRKFPPAIMTLDSPGGGGWGRAADRDPELVRNDVLDGLVSVQAARELYGVVLTGTNMTLDVEATSALRTRLRQESQETASIA